MVGCVRRTGPPLMTQQEGAVWLATQMAGRRVIAAGKLGTSETEALLFYFTMRRGEVKYPYLSDIKKNMTVNAGIFPATDETIDNWARHMIYDVLPALDGVAEWNNLHPAEEAQILNMFSPKSLRFPARSLEPFYETTAATRWTYRIPDNTRVAVVSPFVDTIRDQWPKQHAIWPHTPVWNSKIICVPIKAHYGPYLSPDFTWPEDIRNWRDAVAAMTREVVLSGAKVALIGAGALSLPLAVSLKKNGIAAIHTGGATQIMFGIKGLRWITHSMINTFFNDSWVFPRESEVPAHKTAVEGGCYW